MRNRGEFNFSGNFEVRKDSPLDARTLVDSFEDLKKLETWTDPTGALLIYKGLNVTCKDKPGKVYQLIDFPDKSNPETWKWKVIGGVGDGIQIHDSTSLAALDADDIPDRYIRIPDKENDLNQTAISREVQSDGTYVDILFSAIRKLLSEVARLKNSFNYGICSYTGKNTAMSRVVKGISNPDDEPLWAIEEEDLSQVLSVTIGDGHGLTPEDKVGTGTEGILDLRGTVTWQDDEEVVKSVTDPKLFVYTTVSKPTATIHLKDNDNNVQTIDFSTLNLSSLISYNIMVCISRTVNKQGSSYIYISIGNTQRDLIIAEGYYNPSTNKLLKALIETGHNYTVSSVVFQQLELSKLNFYSKYQDFSREVIPSAPTDLTYKYNVAHITIRAVDSEDILQSIKTQLLENELIYVQATRKLWIKNNGNLINISSSGGGGTTDTGMTEAEVKEYLKNMGIVKEDGGNLQLNDISDITLIHEATGKKFKFTVDSNGNWVSSLIPNDSDKLENRVKASEVTLTKNVRGFIGQLRIAEYNKKNSVKLTPGQDAKLCADRVKIGAFYAPLYSDTVFGCNRAFIELENTSDSDFCLEGCYLHYTKPNNKGEQVVYHLALTGTIPAGGTYLIVGKKYAEADDANTVINVEGYDLEWYINGELADFSTVEEEADWKVGYGFALTYGNAECSATTLLQYSSSNDTDNILGTLGLAANKFPLIIDPSFIDGIYYKSMVTTLQGTGYWAGTAVNIKSNTMYKNMFELDPAKQAYQALNTTDSSRARWASNKDIWVVDLSKKYISFPHSEDTYPVSRFTPKPSYMHKNVCTDKSKLDREKPNMVTCAFGKDIYSVRTFNWISVGYFDEYVWLRKKGTDSWTSKFASYTPVTEAETAATDYPRRKVYSVDLTNAAYARITGRFPADNTFYTSHKCVVELKDSSVDVTAPEQWEYVVGRPDKNGLPDAEHSSAVMSFTVYPKSYTPVIYQTTDQQGFHWIEYQVWAAASEMIYKKIKADQAKNNIIPILFNTGDMTQNGTRINEWYDYYQAGRTLFREYEQMNVVGNNDLCGTNVNDLGTGDDLGKSNSFYFHVFYCYDIDESLFEPIVNGKYIPSLYYFDTKDFRIIMINSEITEVNCKQWYNLVDSSGNAINIYTGYTVASTQQYYKNFTPIYNMLFKIMNDGKTKGKQLITACHEMPFTVITNSSLKNNTQNVSRSLSGTSLVGSHCNLISNADSGKGIYWLSRLLEFMGCKLMLGGHKHTYACTYPLREYFYFGDNKNSKDNYADYTMAETLENDNVTWIKDSKNLTKFPLTKRADVGQASSGFYPYTPVPDLTGGVTYFMCQATSFKYASNKELPSANQKFSMIIPNTTVTSSGSDKASTEQYYPMFSAVNLTKTAYNISLIRVAGIFTDGTYAFSQTLYNKGAMKLQYFKQNDTNNFGSWVDNEQISLTV